MVEERGFRPEELVADAQAAGSGASMLKKEFSSLSAFGYGPADYFGGTLRKLLDDVRAHGKQGLSIYRFKGLGEMDDVELYETTMIPMTRHMLRVRLDDAVAADRMFTLLMARGRAPPSSSRTTPSMSATSTSNRALVSASSQRDGRGGAVARRAAMRSTSPRITPSWSRVPDSRSRANSSWAARS